MDRNIPREDQQDAQQWAEEDAAAGYVTYQLTQEETDVFLAEDQAAPTVVQLRLRITQALREAGDPAHVDVLLADGTIGWTMDIR